MSNKSSVERLMVTIMEEMKQGGEEEVKFISSHINVVDDDGANLLRQLNSSWEVPFDTPLIHPPTLKGRLKTYIKKIISKTINWRIHSINIGQNLFNANAVRIINYLDKKLEENKSTIHELQQQVKDLSTIVQSLTKESNKNLHINYLDFENEFRGSRSLIKEYQSIYLKYISKGMKVLDLGCGRGEFVELLTTNNISVLGVDNNEEMIQECIKLKLPVVKDDLFNYLETTNDKFDCIFISQVIEHLDHNELIALIQLCNKKLKNKGLLIMETPNPETILVSSYTFYLDHTHAKPIPPVQLSFIVQQFNFSVLETLYFHPFEDNNKLQELVSDDHVLNSNFKLLNDKLFGPRDYAIIAEKRDGESIDGE